MWLDRFTVSVAQRHLRYGRGQSLLTAGVVAIAVLLIIFLGGLIGGLQNRLIRTTTGAIPHIVLQPVEREPIALWDLPDAFPRNGIAMGTRVRLPLLQNKIEDWRIWLPAVTSFDASINAVSPVAEGQGFIFRGAKRESVRIVGVLPEQHNRIVPLEDDLLEGRFFGLNAGEVVLGVDLARDFGLSVGDRVRLLSAEQQEGAYTVAGIFETGFSGVDNGVVYLPLRDAQSLLRLGNAITSIGLRIDRIFEANALADRMSEEFPFEARSWMRDNISLLSGLRAQSQSTNLILVMTTLAAGLTIASILIMSVSSKYKEIGILKAMGARPGQILGLFTLEGLILSFIGSLMGAVTGFGLLRFLGSLETAPTETGRTTQVFAVEFEVSTFAGAILVAMIVGWLASLYPAWRASRVNAIEVIRGT